MNDPLSATSAVARGTERAGERDLVPLPRALALCLWTGAYLRGDCGPDDAVQGAHGTGHRHVEHLDLDLFDWMTAVRRLPLVAVRPVLPAPGRIAGLVGPPAAIAAALAAEQALVVTAGGIADSTLIPAAETIGSPGEEGLIVRWASHPAPPGAPMPPPPTDGARSRFLRALQQAARSTARLDLVPDEPIPLAHLPESWTAIALPPRTDPQAGHLLLLAARTLLLSGAELEAADPVGSARTGTPGLAAQTSRTALLRELRDAAREALVDAVGTLSAP